MVQWCTLRMQESWQADVSAEEGGSAPGPAVRKQETCVCKGFGRQMCPQRRAETMAGGGKKARNLRMQGFWQADASAEEGGSDPGPAGKKQETCVCKSRGRWMCPQRRADQTPGQREKARNLRMQESWQADVSAEEGGSVPGQRKKQEK